MDSEELLERVRALRATGRTPKEVARALGLRPAQVTPCSGGSPLKQRRRLRRQVLRLLGEPGWSHGRTVEGHPGWPDVDAADAEALGLVSVVVTRQERYGRCACAAGWVDVDCLGVKDVVGRRAMDERRAADFRSWFFAAYQARPLEAPLELAQHLVLGAVEYARSLGFEPARGFAATTDQLGLWAARAPSASGATRETRAMSVVRRLEGKRRETRPGRRV